MIEKIKKVIVVDWLDKYGGAERVIKSMQEIFQFDDFYTLINIMNKHDYAQLNLPNEKNFKQSGLKVFGKYFRYFLFLFHFFIDVFKIDKSADIIISSSHAVAKGVKKGSPNQLHISYFQARNFNYIWDDKKLFFGKFLFIVNPFLKILQHYDVKQAQNPDFIVCNSFFVKKWVLEKYNRDAIVIYPPVDLKDFDLQEEKQDYFVIVGRLAKVKRFDIVIQAFNLLGRKLIVIGDGEEFQKLNEKANSNIEFKGFLDSKQVNSYVKNAKALIQSGVEGFGIATIEAQACGTPIIAYEVGAVVETVVPFETGVFFDHQTSDSLINAIKTFESLNFEPIKIRENALKFSKENFESKLKTFVEEKWVEHLKKIS